MALVKFTIDQWCEQEHDLIDEFVVDWYSLHDTDPEKWLGEMSAGEWDDMFELWHQDCAQKTPEET